MIEQIGGLERFRTMGQVGSRNGMFQLRCRDSYLKVMTSDGYGWDHVSVSVIGEDRCPNWTEMTYVKSLFFKRSETAIQYHVPDAEHVNYHRFCLHLWRPQGQVIQRPPKELVGAPPGWDGKQPTKTKVPRIIKRPTGPRTGA